MIFSFYNYSAICIWKKYNYKNDSHRKISFFCFMEENLSESLWPFSYSVNSLRVIASDAASSLTQGRLMGLHPV